MASIHRTQARERAYKNMLKAGIKHPYALQKDEKKSTMFHTVYKDSFFSSIGVKQNGRSHAGSGDNGGNSYHSNHLLDVNSHLIDGKEKVKIWQ